MSKTNRGRSSNSGRGRGGKRSARPSQHAGGGGSRPSSGRGQRGAAGRRGQGSGGKRHPRDRSRRRGKFIGKPSGRGSGARGEATPRTEEQERYDGPPIPEEISGRELARPVQDQLRSLPEKLGLRVARHLATAQLLLLHDPKTAYEHTLAARARAVRLAVVREAVGEAAYFAGEYETALTELRAARRMNGAPAYIPIMVDCLRALGRPDKALAMAKEAPRQRMSSAELAELMIVESGARRDRGEFDAALRVLEQGPLHSQQREPWMARLRYAYADALVGAQRPAEALEWFHRAAAVDREDQTDALERASTLEKLLNQQNS